MVRHLSSVCVGTHVCALEHVKTCSSKGAAVQPFVQGKLSLVLMDMWRLLSLNKRFVFLIYILAVFFDI